MPAALVGDCVETRGPASGKVGVADAELLHPAFAEDVVTAEVHAEVEFMSSRPLTPTERFSFVGVLPAREPLNLVRVESLAARLPLDQEVRVALVVASSLPADTVLLVERFLA